MRHSQNMTADGGTDNLFIRFNHKLGMLFIRLVKGFIHRHMRMRIRHDYIIEFLGVFLCQGNAVDRVKFRLRAEIHLYSLFIKGLKLIPKLKVIRHGLNFVGTV